MFSDNHFIQAFILSQSRHEESTMQKPKRGGGPKTPQGKAVVSKNAIKFGNYSNSIFMPNPKKIDSELKKVVNEYGAETTVEIGLLRDYVVLTLRKMNLEQTLQEDLDIQFSKRITSDELFRECGKEISEEVVDLINVLRYRETDQKWPSSDYPEFIKFLESLLEDGIPLKEAFAYTLDDFPYFKLSLTMQFNGIFSKNINYKELNDHLDTIVEIENGQSIKFLDLALSYLKEDYDDYSSYLRMSNLVKPAIEIIMNDRKIKTLEKHNFTRWLDDIDRAKCRVLNQFLHIKKYRLESQFMEAKPV
jgi:hypothetical protein